MLKKSISLLLAVMVLAGMFSSFSAGATEKDTLTDSAPVKSITLKADNNIATYLDEDGNEVDITENSAQRRMRTMPTKYIVTPTHSEPSKNAPAKSAITGSFAPQGIKGVSIAVALRSRSLRIVRQAIMPGIAQPVPMMKGMTDLPERPTFLKIGSRTTVVRAI